MQFDCIISGGGMVGLTLALALEQGGLRVAAIEREPLGKRTPDARVSAIALGQAKFLERLGVWDAMRAQAEPITDIRVTDGHSPIFLHFNHHEVTDAPFGYIVENNITAASLSEKVAASGITVFAPAQISAFEVTEGQVNVTLANGQVCSAPLLIGADGRRSFIRETLEIPVVRKPYRQTAIVATISHTKPHHGLAQERFLPKGPFAVLPMKGNRSSLVWVEPERVAPIYVALAKPALEAEITKRIGDYLGEISLLDTPVLYPLSLEFAETYVAPRVALVGDAAHGIHPIAGQGVNLGFRDVDVLAEILTKRHTLGLDLGAMDGLEAYERAQMGKNLLMIAGTDGINALFSNNILPFRLLRGAGLVAVSKLPILKRAFIRHAMGISAKLS